MKKGSRLTAHAQGLNGIKKAIRWGVRMIEHGIFLDEEVCEEMVKKNSLLNPILRPLESNVKKHSRLVLRAFRQMERHRPGVEHKAIGTRGHGCVK